MPTGQGDIGTILLSPFEDGHYSDYTSVSNKSTNAEELEPIGQDGFLE